jgi:hypothetical protein
MNTSGVVANFTGKLHHVRTTFRCSR